MAVLALGGCGSHAHSAAPSAAAAASALAGSPPALAALHAQGGKLLHGGVAAFEARMRSLRGYPVVVNKWASWCGPCQGEFPLFQQAAVHYGKDIGFVGDNGNDHDAAARSFLRSYPVTYPSYADPRQTIAAAIHAPSYFPETVFFDRQGRLVFDHIGAYASLKALESDIAHYAVGGA